MATWRGGLQFSFWSIESRCNGEVCKNFAPNVCRFPPFKEDIPEGVPLNINEITEHFLWMSPSSKISYKYVLLQCALFITFPSACFPHERYFPSITAFPPARNISSRPILKYLNEYFSMNKYASTKLVSPVKVCCWGWCMCINIFADMTVGLKVARPFVSWALDFLP